VEFESNPSFAKEGFAQQIGEKSQIRNQHSPIANLEHPSALSLAIRYARKVIDKADCIRMFQIGDRRMLIAYFRTEFVQARFVGQSRNGSGRPCSFVALSLLLPQKSVRVWAIIH